MGLEDAVQKGWSILRDGMDGQNTEIEYEKWMQLLYGIDQLQYGNEI